MWGSAACIISTATFVATAVSVPVKDFAALPATVPGPGSARQRPGGLRSPDSPREPQAKLELLAWRAGAPSRHFNNNNGTGQTGTNRTKSAKKDAQRHKKAVQFTAWRQLSELSRWRYQQEHPQASEEDVEAALKRERTYGMRSSDAAVAPTPGPPTKTTKKTFPSDPRTPDDAKARQQPQREQQQQQQQKTPPPQKTSLPQKAATAQSESKSEMSGSVADADTIMAGRKAEVVGSVAALPSTEQADRALKDAASRLGRAEFGDPPGHLSSHLPLEDVLSPGEHHTQAAHAEPDPAKAKRCVANSTRSAAERWERERQLSLSQVRSTVVHTSHRGQRWALRPKSSSLTSFDHGLEALNAASFYLDQLGTAEAEHFAAMAGEGAVSKLAAEARHRVRLETFDMYTLKQDDSGMFDFIKSMVEEVGGEVLDEGGLAGIVPFYSGSKDLQSFARLMEEIQAIAHLPDSWLRMPPNSCYKALQMGYGPNAFPNGVGDVASLNEQGYQAVAFTRRSPEMAKFIRRLIEDKNFQVEDEGGVLGLVPFYSGECGTRSFGELMAEIHAVASMPGKWLRRKGARRL